MANRQSEIVINVAKSYTKYHVGQIVTNRFTHISFLNALGAFESNEQLSFSTVGFSEEGRAINSITFGAGKTKVLLWSQMHGNESTATRAILDILHFLTADDEFNSLREEIAKNLTLQFVPMLNPDGTERFQRRTATEIDMNRDAVALQSPEGKLLNKIVLDFNPEIAFNLHDQRRFYNVKNTGVPSSMSFLAPAHNQEREVNTVRKKAMQLIAGMNKLLQSYIPKGVGLYDDTYSHRSFGDAIQAQKVSTILVESGRLPNDMEKEGIRKLNFTALLTAFEMIARNSFKDYSVNDYASIPAIDTKLFDVLIKNIKVNGKPNSIVDIGVNRTEYLVEHPGFYAKGVIGDIGDLSTFYGFETVNAKGLTAVAGKSITIDSLEAVSMITVKRLLKQGVLFLITEDLPLENYVPFPINIVHPRKLSLVSPIKFEGKANFLLVDKNKVLKFIVLNGFVVKPGKIDTSINGLVLV